MSNIVASYLHVLSSCFNLLRYITIRSVGAFLASFLCVIIGVELFLRLGKRKFQALSRENTPASHVQKNSTPTMGGLVIIAVLLMQTAVWVHKTPAVFISLLSLILFGCIGAYDDWSKIFRKKGISVGAKYGWQVACAFLVCAVWFLWCAPFPYLIMPIFKKADIFLGSFLVLWGMFVLVATANAVNLTDGLDGLASGPLMLSFMTYAVISYLVSSPVLSSYFHIPCAATGELTVCCAAATGCLLGFLWYNSHPAQLFMGDVGSQALGAFLGAIALCCRQEALLPVIGGVFVAETISVIMQVASYKLRDKKRIFKMAPLHHHFELSGWSETKITLRFWIVSFILSIIGLVFIKMR